MITGVLEIINLYQKNSEDSEQHGKLNGGRNEIKLFPGKVPTFTSSQMKLRSLQLAIHREAGTHAAESGVSC